MLRAAITNVYKPYYDLVEYSKSNNYDTAMKGHITWLLYISATSVEASVTFLDSSKHKGPCVGIAGAEGKPAVITLTEDAIANANVTAAEDADAVTKDDLEVLLRNVKPFAQYVQILCACEQVKPLSSPSYQNFFKMVGIKAYDNRVPRVIQYLSAVSKNPELAASETIKSLRASNKFVMYHTTAVSTPLLITRMHDELPGPVKAMIPDKDVETAKRALTSYNVAAAADGISQKTLCLAYIYFTVSSQGTASNDTMKEWVQGKRAFDATPVPLRNAMTALMKKQLAIIAATDAIEDIENLEGIMEYFSKKL